MVVQRVDINTRIKRERIKQAISLAMESRWEEAVAANRQLLQADGKDVDALNRLGKALTELGQYRDARKAFSSALALAPSNPIARKNLDRIDALGDDTPVGAHHARVSPQFFIEETGKTGMTALVDGAPREVLARTSTGEPVELVAEAHRLVVRNGDGEYLGAIEPKLGLRLLGLVRGGNKYAAAIAAVEEGEVRVFIRETYQHLSQRGRLSFPTKSVDGFRPYVWEGAYRYGQDDDEDTRLAGLDWEDSSEDDVAPAPRRRVPVAVADEDDF